MRNRNVRSADDQSIGAFVAEYSEEIVVEDGNLVIAGPALQNVLVAVADKVSLKNDPNTSLMPTNVSVPWLALMNWDVTPF